MKSAALSNGSGPGSSIALSPTSIRVRDAIIEKFIDKSLDELNNFLTSALDTERDESKRIGILAARVYILRTRISKIMEFNQNSMIPSIDDITPNELVNKLQHFDEPILGNEPLAEDTKQLEDWNELLTLEDGEINGVRIPRGVAITVGRADATRLIDTGKAELIKEEKTAENPMDEQDETPDSQDMSGMNTEVGNPTDEQDATPDSPDMPVMNAEVENPMDEQDETPDSPDIPDMNTEAENPIDEQDETPDSQDMSGMNTEVENPMDEQDATPDSPDMPGTNTEVENPTDEIDATPDSPDMPGMNAETETELAGQVPIEQTVEISADGEEPVLETTVEVSDMSVDNAIAGDAETSVQETLSTDDTQTQYVDEAEIDATKPQK